MERKALSEILIPPHKLDLILLPKLLVLWSEKHYMQARLLYYLREYIYYHLFKLSISIACTEQFNAIV